MSAIQCEGVLIGSAAGYEKSGFFPSDKEAIANARLIAAAPKLLQACQAFMNYRTVVELDVVVGLVREAIAKAVQS